MAARRCQGSEAVKSVERLDCFPKTENRLQAGLSNAEPSGLQGICGGNTGGRRSLLCLDLCRRGCYKFHEWM